MESRNIAREPVFTTKDRPELRKLLAHRNSSIRNHPGCRQTICNNKEQTLIVLCYRAPGYEEHDTGLMGHLPRPGLFPPEREFQLAGKLMSAKS